MEGQTDDCLRQTALCLLRASACVQPGPWPARHPTAEGDRNAHERPPGPACQVTGSSSRGHGDEDKRPPPAPPPGRLCQRLPPLHTGKSLEKTLDRRNVNP